MIVRTEGLSVRYGATTAVDGIDLTASPGSVLAIIGPNGSGKSSLIKAIAGVVRSAGKIHFDDSPVRPSAISYMAQDIGGQAALTVLEVVLLGRLRRLGLMLSKSEIASVQQVISDLDLSPLAARYLGELSGGQRQIVFLAQALVAEPSVLLLDEPISALDLRHQLEVLDLVRARTIARGLTTICVLHDLNATARIADRVAMIRQGQLLAVGPPGDVITPRTLAEGFEVDAEIISGCDGTPVVRPLRPRTRSGWPSTSP